MTTMNHKGGTLDSDNEPRERFRETKNKLVNKNTDPNRSVKIWVKIGGRRTC